MGMAYLLGQINLNPDAYAALALLRAAYKSSTIDCPQPAYVYGMLLAGEMEVTTEIPYSLVLPQNTHDTAALSSQLAQAREALERAAYLCLPQAQYKCGWMYEHASYGCAYDPLMSVQWYSLASQGGEVEADMALSKWFLCGAEGHFGKNEKLARTFAEKAARKGHQNGSFAMGYYYE
jgi:TPR repeat protein